jgi:cystathionine beta-lyase
LSGLLPAQKNAPKKKKKIPHVYRSIDFLFLLWYIHGCMYNFDTIIPRGGTDSYKWNFPGDPPDMVQMWVADMDFPSPREITGALRQRSEHPVYGYSRVGEDLLDAFIAWQDSRHGWKIQKDWIIPCPGVVPCLHFAIDALSREGEGVVIQTPVYPPFARAVRALGRRLILNPLVREGMRYRMDLEHLDSVIDGQTRILILCSPHNPVGRVWTERELAALGELCLTRGLIIVSDDIHCDLVMPGSRFVPLAPLSGALAHNTLTVIAPSKTFNIPGVGSAFAVIPNPELRRVFRLAGEKTALLHLNSLYSSVAARAAYRFGETWLAELLPYLRDNYLFLKDFFARELPRVGVTELEGTYLAWLDFSAYGLRDAELTKILLEKARVRLNDGPSFGKEGEGFQRLNFGCPRATLEEGLRRIAGAFGP